MKDSLLALKDNLDPQSKGVVALCAVSVFVHALIFYFRDFNWPSTPIQYEEWVIETDLATPEETKKVVHEQPVKQEAQAQLPSNFAEKSDKIDIQKDAQPVLQEKKEEESENAEEETKAKKLDEETKKAALARLLKEEKQVQKVKQSQATRDSVAKKAINELIKRNKEELIRRQGAKLANSSGSGTESVHPYIAELRNWLLKFYQIPEIYLERFHDQDYPILDVTFDAEGNIRKLSIFQPSKDSTLDQLAMKTVQDAAPVPKPPSEFVGRVIRLPFYPPKK